MCLSIMNVFAKDTLIDVFRGYGNFFKCIALIVLRIVWGAVMFARLGAPLVAGIVVNNLYAMHTLGGYSAVAIGGERHAEFMASVTDGVSMVCYFFCAVASVVLFFKLYRVSEALRDICLDFEAELSVEFAWRFKTNTQ